VGNLRAAVERTLAAGTARLRLFCARDRPDTWWDAGHGTADFRHRRTHLVFHPIRPDAPLVGLTPDLEVEYLFDGGARWVKRLDETQWGHPLGASDDPRQAGDPTWILDALFGAATIGDQHDAASGLRVSLDLTVAARVIGHQVDLGRGRAALHWRPRLRRWRKAVPARVWLDETGRLRRAEHFAPPWSRLFPSQTWVGVEFSALGAPVDLPSSPSAVP
jgi:hypothetical protein